MVSGPASRPVSVSLFAESDDELDRRFGDGGRGGVGASRAGFERGLAVFAVASEKLVEL
jgi:hypothetical protein